MPGNRHNRHERPLGQELAVTFATSLYLAVLTATGLWLGDRINSHFSEFNPQTDEGRARIESIGQKHFTDAILTKYEEGDINSIVRDLLFRTLMENKIEENKIEKITVEYRVRSTGTARARRTETTIVIYSTDTQGNTKVTANGRQISIGEPERFGRVRSSFTMNKQDL